jgi:hypothetical protein
LPHSCIAVTSGVSVQRSLSHGDVALPV